MSFSALLGKITKDKKLEEKVKQFSTPAKPSTSLKPQINTKIKKPIVSLSSLSSISYPQDNDPAVRRLKEARRLEKEKQNAIKNAKYGKKVGSAKSKSSTRASTPSSTNNSRRSTTPLESRKKIPSKAEISPHQPQPKSRFKFKPLKHNLKISDAVRASSTTVPPPSKVSFTELMEQASKIDKPLTASANFHFTKKQNNSKEPSKAFQSLQKSRTREEHEQKHRQGPEEQHRKSKHLKPQQKERAPVAYAAPVRPAGFAKPNSELIKRLKNKPQPQSLHPLQQRRTDLYGTTVSSKKSDVYDIDAQDDEDEYDEYGYSYGYDDGYDSQDDFIVDDEDYGQGAQRSRQQRKRNDLRHQGYSKDEIWEIFGRGRKRDFDRYDDYNSDDMEATGTEILEEEDRTLKQAKLDDLREQRMLEERALEKRKKLNR